MGHDGGLDISNDGGFTWDYHNDIAVGQFYQVSADMRRPYHVCGGLQDNNAWCAPSALRSSSGPVNTDWYTVAGGDGFYTRQDPTDWAIVYAESQDGNMSRHNLKHSHPEEREAHGCAANNGVDAGGGGRKCHGSAWLKREPDPHKSGHHQSDCRVPRPLRLQLLKGLTAGAACR